MQNQFLTFIVLLPIALCTSCIEKNSSNYISQIPDAINVDSIEIITTLDSITITEPLEIGTWGITDSAIWIIDYAYDGAICNLFSKDTGKKIDEYGNYGQGPYEFITMNPGYARQAKDLMFYDIMSAKLVLCAIENNLFSPMRTYILPKDSEGLTYPYTNINQINDSIFLMKFDTDKESGWQIYNLNCNKGKCIYKNTIRNPNQSYTPFDYAQAVNDSLIVVAYHYIDLVEIYGIDEEFNKITLVKRLGRTETQEFIADYNGLKHEYLCVSIVNNMAYCLRTNDGSEIGSTILCFDLDSLKPIKQLTLDYKVNSIIFDKDSNLWGIRMNPETTTILSFGQVL